MDRLYSWSARRSGKNITVTHSCGKVTNVTTIEPRGNGKLVAITADNREIELYVPY